jgi:protein-disulfide isomerase
MKKMNRASGRIMKAAIAKCNAAGLEFRSMALLEASDNGSYVMARITGTNGSSTFTLEVFYNEHEPIVGKTWSVRWTELNSMQCPYCKGHSDSTDSNVLCQECRQTFGHSTIGEL